MSATNVYCDESCHLENGTEKTMVLGAVWCPLDKTREIAERLREIKREHVMPDNFELKWTKVSAGREAYFRAVLDYFFDNSNLHFRGLVIPDKFQLRHADFGQDHDTWYYKMMFSLLSPILSPKEAYRVYLDKKDTRSATKVEKLHEVLCKNLYDFDRKIIQRVQVITSHDVEQLQLADFLIGAVGYANRKLTTNAIKVELVNRMRQRSGYTLTHSTLLREAKLNLFIWQPKVPFNEQ